jgi:hypothetical protein
MKRLLILTMLAALTAPSAGCSSCCPPRRPQYRPCVPAPTCCTPTEGYTTPGIITTAPTLSMPQNVPPVQVIPGPAAYVPAP